MPNKGHYTRSVSLDHIAANAPDVHITRSGIRLQPHVKLALSDVVRCCNNALRDGDIDGAIETLVTGLSRVEPGTRGSE